MQAEPGLVELELRAYGRLVTALGPEKAWRGARLCRDSRMLLVHAAYELGLMNEWTFERSADAEVCSEAIEAAAEFGW